MTAHELYTLAEIKAREDGTIYDSAPLPETVLSIGINFNGPDIIWYRKENRATLSFSKDINIKGSQFWCPTLVFHYSASQIRVVATEDQFPTLKSKALYAPFPNMTNQNVCMGTSDPGDMKFETIADLISTWEDRFIHGEFTHDTTEPFIGKITLKEYYEQANKRLPIELIKRYNKTIKEVFA